MKKKHKSNKLIVADSALPEKVFLLTKKGISLIEVLITLMVISFGVVGVSALMAGNIRTANNAKNQIIAATLAQEAVELVKNSKDNKEASLEAAVAGVYSDKRIDSVNPIINTDADKRLYINNGLYTHNSSGTPTKFYRNISVSITGAKLPTPSTRVVTTTAMVTWNGTGIPAVCNIANKCVSLVSVLPD